MPLTISSYNLLFLCLLADVISINALDIDMLNTIMFIHEMNKIMEHSYCYLLLTPEPEIWTPVLIAYHSIHAHLTIISDFTTPK